MKATSIGKHPRPRLQAEMTQTCSRLAFAGKVRLAGLLGLVVLCACTSIARADNVSVSYTAQQVSGTTWQYQYTLSGTMSQGDDLAIFFPLGTTASLKDASSTNNDFTTFVLQPDPALPADGEVDLTAVVMNPDLLQNFSVLFTYSGAGAPAGQNFTLFDGNYNVLATGTTAAATPPAATPEPGSLVLAATGALAMFEGVRRRIRG